MTSTNYPTIQLVKAASAQSFRDSVGVTSHIASGQAHWQKINVLEREMAYLNVKSMRADAPYSWELPIYKALANMGVRFSLFEANMFITGGVVDASIDVKLADALQTAVPGSVVSFEGANEYENNDFTLNGHASRGDLGWGLLDAAQLRAAVAADPILAGVKIVAPATLSYETAVPDLGRYVDVSNWHVYGGVGEQLADAMSTGIALARSSAPGAPVYITETGIASSGYGSSDWGVTDEATQGIIDTNAVLDGFASGAAKTFLYELMDDTNASVHENSFGLFRSDGSAKPVATDIHNLMAILSDTGSGLAQTGTLAYSLTGLPATASTMLLEKSNGTFDIVIWNARAVVSDGSRSIDPPASTVTVSFDASHPAINLYDPILGQAPIQAATIARMITFGLGKDPLILEVPAATSSGAGKADFDGDRKADLLWHQADGSAFIWSLDGAHVRSSDYVGTLDRGQQLLAVGDFDADHKADVLTRDGSSNLIRMADTRGALMLGADVATVSSSDSLVAAADFNGDGATDLLWRNGATGNMSLWDMQGHNVVGGGTVATLGPKTTVLSAGDFNGNGKADLLLRNDASGDLFLWTMDNATVASSAYVATMPASQWELAASADLNGDGKTDLVWRDKISGNMFDWQMDGATATSGSYVATLSPTMYHVAAAGDFNGDGRSDLLYEDTSRNLVVGLMNGSSTVGGGYIGTAPVDWTLCNRS